MFYVGKILQALARNAIQSLAPLAAFFVAFEGDPVLKLALAVGGLALFTVAFSLLRYWFFRYAIVGNSILIRDGIFNRKQLDIGFDRIQAVNTRQNILYRALGLTTVTFDSAGSSAEEGYLPAVGNAVADDLRARIRAIPARVLADDRQPDDDAVPRIGSRELMRLGVADVVLAGLSSGKVFMLLAVLGPLGELAERDLGRRMEETAVVEAVSALRPDAATGILLLLAVLAVVLVLLLAVSVIAAFLRYHGFVLTTDGDVIRSRGGLFTVHEHSLSRAKVQSVIVSRNPILHLFGRYGLRVRQVSGGRIGGGGDFLVPIARAADLRAIGKEVFRDELVDLALDAPDSRFERVSRYYIRSRFVLFGVLPACGLLLLPWTSFPTRALFAALWLPVCALGVHQLHRRLGVLVVADGLAFRRGLIGRRVVVCLHRKVQRVGIDQSPVQRRNGLATLRLHLAAGHLRIPFVPHADARRLRDYILYRIEASQVSQQRPSGQTSATL